ncbi:DUF2190 family protein [Luteipulveratus sp. YIM 133132]|uniref:DUF2190 family protein n=1 Tax=Luteipulveratus flavus TaxID=3031728 RepID=UPI0023B11E38|nr:DUF2190 family protein [Luteipulveratus sp. YIM 133132]MDE9364579.1 DUF2190 family protein [Luteipulveratus sp. YIM 133132]
MADYLPLFKPGTDLTMAVTADVVGGQVVELTGVESVGPAGAASTKWFGVAGYDAKAGSRVVVYKGGTQRPVASGAVAVGDLVTTAAGGKVVTAATPSVGAFVGVAVSAATDGQTVLIDFVR